MQTFHFFVFIYLFFLQNRKKLNFFIHFISFSKYKVIKNFQTYWKKFQLSHFFFDHPLSTDGPTDGQNGLQIRVLATRNNPFSILASGYDYALMNMAFVQLFFYLANAEVTQKVRLTWDGFNSKQPIMGGNFLLMNFR